MRAKRTLCAAIFLFACIGMLCGCKAAETQSGVPVFTPTPIFHGTESGDGAGAGETQPSVTIPPSGLLTPKPKETSISTVSTPQNATPAAGDLRITFLDVGQADCTVIQADGELAVIDAGNAEDRDIVLGFLRSVEADAGIRYLIATHPHEDHIGSASYILDAFPVGMLLMPNVATDETITYERMMDAAKRRGVQIVNPPVGARFELGHGSFTVLSPSGSAYEDLNDWSLGIKLSYGDIAMVACGDAESVSETEIVMSGQSIRADILKVNHHGSSSSSSWPFLAAVMPRYAIISSNDKEGAYGEGGYGHPAKKTISNLSLLGATIYRTDTVGTITAISDGKTITFETEEH